jgi:hypothetical protein
MPRLHPVLAELLGLFVDDGSLALAALLLVAVVAVLAKLAMAPPILIGALLAIGCLAILIESVLRAARR